MSENKIELNTEKMEEQKPIEEPKLITPDKKNLDAPIAALLSFFVPGLGQGINGQLGKGVVMFFVMQPIFLLLILVFGCLTCGLGFLIFPVINILSAVDAYFCTKKLEKGESLELFEFHLKEENISEEK